MTKDGEFYDEIVIMPDTKEYNAYLKRVSERVNEYLDSHEGVKFRFTMLPEEVPEVPEGSVLDAFLELGD